MTDKCEHHDHSMVEDYIRSLQWSEGTPDIHKTLVAGNIRGFYAHMRATNTAATGMGDAPSSPWLDISELEQSDDLFWFLRKNRGEWIVDGPRKPQSDGYDADEWTWFAACESPPTKALAAQPAPVVSTPVEATGLVSTDEVDSGTYADIEDSREVGSAYRCAATPAQPAPVVGGDARKDWVVVPMNPSPSVLDYLLIPTLGNWHGMLALCPVPPKLAARPGGEGELWGYADPKSGRSIHRNLITSTVKVGALGEVGEMVDASTIYTVPLYTHPAPLLAARPGGDDSARLDYIERTFGGCSNQERYLPLRMLWGKGANGRTLRDACDKYMARDAAHPAQAGGGQS